MQGMYTAISKVENLAQVSSCKLKFVHHESCWKIIVVNVQPLASMTVINKVI
jgi:hypothetical protein